MNCSDAEILIVQSAQDELPPSEEARLKRHLSSCSDCRKVMAEYREIWDVMDVWSVPEPPQYLQRVFNRRLAETAGHSRKALSLFRKVDRPYRQGRFWSNLRWNLAGLAVAASLLVGTFYLFVSQNEVQIPSSNVSITERESTVISETRTPSGTVLTATSSTPRNRMPGMAAVPGNRVPATGILVESAPRPGYSPQQANFAVHNFSANVPEMNTKSYNTVHLMYGNPL